MSNALVIGTLMDSGLIPAIKSAWAGGGVTVTISEDDFPRTAQQISSTNLFVSLIWDRIKISLDGFNAAASESNQDYEFDIYLFFPMPPADGAHKISRVKANYASQLIAALQTGPGFAGIANLPLVTEVDPKDVQLKFEGASTLRCRFSCQVGADHH